jgi:hypothetical protein
MLRWVLRHVARLSGWLNIPGLENDRVLTPRVVGVASNPESFILGSM